MRQMRFRRTGMMLAGLLGLSLGSLGAQDLSGIPLKGTKITYWYQHSQGREAALQTMITRFNTTNPWGITVHGEYAGTYSDIANKMIAGIAGSDTPDLVVAYQNNAATYQKSDALVDLNPYVNDHVYGISAQDRPDFFEGFLAQDVYPQFGNARLGWPPNRSVEVLYYNADWLKALHRSGPPKTWEEFYEDCRLATDPAKGTYGYAINLDASGVFSQVISRGGDFRTADGKGYQLNTKALVDSFAFMQKLSKEGYAHKVGDEFGDQTDFANGKVLFTVTSTAGIPFYAQAVQKGAQGPFQWNVAAFPGTAQPTLDIFGASVSVVKSNPARQLAAWLFLRWMSEPAQQAEWVKASNYFPVRKSTDAALADYLAQNPQFARAFRLLQGSTLKTEPGFAGYDLVRDAISTAYNQILDGADVPTTVASLDEKAQRIGRQSH